MSDHPITVKVKARKVAKAPHFNLLLFRTRFDVALPSPTAKVPRDSLGQTVDVRPFLNTATRDGYDCNEEVGRCLRNLYFSAWKLRGPRLWSRSPGHVQLRLNGLGVTRADRANFRDLRDPNTARTWLNGFYASRPSGVIEEPGDAPLQNGGVELSTENIGGHAIFRSRPARNMWDFLLPFAGADMLQFRWVYCAQRGEAHEAAMMAIENFARDVLETVTLEEESPEEVRRAAARG